MKHSKLISLVLTIAMVLSMVAALGITASAGQIVPTNEEYLDLDSTTADIKDTKTLDQNYSLAVTPRTSASGAVTKVKVSWAITDINAMRIDNKVWDTTELKWVVASSDTVIFVDGAANFTFENYSSVKVRATASFVAETGFNPTVTYTCKNGRIILDTANGNDTYSKTNVPTGTIGVTVKPSETDFTTASATTSAKYGTYTVTLSEDVSDYQSYVNTIATASAPSTFVVDEANKTITIKDEKAFLYYGLKWNVTNAANWTAKLDADIDLDYLVIANGFNCYANFDGQNHTIANLTVTGASNGSAGLFQTVSADVKNLVLDNVQVKGGVSTGDSCCGILAGEANANTIENVTVKNSSVTNGKFTGGLVGYAYVHNIKYCSVIDTTISCQYKSGALVGYICEECANPADDYSNVTNNTLTNVTINCANLLEGKNHYETGKVIGNWNVPTGKFIDNTVSGVTIVNGSDGYTDNEIGAVESGCDINYGEN